LAQIFQGRFPLGLDKAARVNSTGTHNYHPNSPVVPEDPYCGDQDGFERVLDLVEDASEGLLRHVMAQVT
jgi:protein-tyrosine-phosphatase